MSFFCDQCGREMDRRMERCPNCGAVNRYTVQKVPRTIGELRDFAAGQGLPLDKMHVYLGVNYTKPKAYGIYQESDGMFIVYKNKADGTRAVRYHGPDEAHAVYELYQKMLQEMDQQRRIGAAKPITSPASGRKSRPTISHPRPTQGKKPVWKRILKVFIITVLSVFAAWCILEYLLTIPSGGYYMVDDDYYYYQSGSWYYYDDTYGDWYYYGDDEPYTYGSYEDYYYGDDYDTSYDVRNFYFSDYYEDPTYSNDYSGSSYTNNGYSSWDDDDDSYDSYDYSSWDDSGSDWDSDW